MVAYTDLVRHAGNEPLYQAVELSVLGMAKGYPLHLHAEGLRGTGKTTILRAARGFLPAILRVRGCLYNCDPQAPHCPEHRSLGPAELLRAGSEWVPAPFLEVSPSAKIGTVVGSIDLGRLAGAERSEAALLPGTLAQAHRGIVFVDEINRLADTSPELADALLDVMGTKPGRLQIEETGLPRIELSCRVTVWAASNPDEEPGPLADIRRQLSDRFDLVVAMRRPSEADQVARVLDVDEFTAAAAAVSTCTDALDALRRAVGRRSARPAPPVDAMARALLAEVYCLFQVESLRAVQAWQAAARLEALRTGAPAVGLAQLRAVAPHVLRHRVEPEDLARVLDFLDEGERTQEREMAGTAVVATASEEEPAAMAPPGSMARGRGWQDIWERLRGALGSGCGPQQPLAGSGSSPTGAAGMPAAATAGGTGGRGGGATEGSAGAGARASAWPASPPAPVAPTMPARLLCELQEHEMLREGPWPPEPAQAQRWHG